MISLQRNMADSIILLFARLKTQCRKFCPCDTGLIAGVYEENSNPLASVDHPQRIHVRGN